MTIPSRHHGADKGLQLRQVGGIHQRGVFGHGLNAVSGGDTQNLLTRGLDIAFAAHVQHGNTLIGAGNVLSRLQRDKIPRTLAVRHDSANGELVIQQNYLVADFQVLGLRHNVVGDGFVRRLKGLPGSETRIPGLAR